MTAKLLLALLLAAPLAAQPAGPYGSWALASAPDLTRVIDEATASMNFITRPIARSRLNKTNQVYPTIRIEAEPGGVAIQYGERPVQHMPSDGRTVAWTREDGEKLMVTTKVEPDSLVQVYKAKDGERANEIHVDAASHTLTLKVTVTSPRLPAPVTYAITYR